METPMWALALMYWLHMVATIVWVGGLAALSLIVIPAAKSGLEKGQYSALLGAVVPRLQSLGWFCLGILVVTGMFQMSASPAYRGFLTFQNTWSWAILIKHLVIGLMVVSSVYLAWGVTPAIQRLAVRRSAKKPVDEETVLRLEQQEETMIRMNMFISILVLALTALARVSA